MRSYATIKALRDGETADFEGVPFRMVVGKESGLKLEEGDLYIAERNTTQLLTVKRVLETSPDGRWAGWVEPVEVAYSFDLGECVGVEMVEA